jgi:hypothetical protein
MQPRLLAIFIVILPLLASNGAFLLSADAGFVPWCVPYIDGCSTISQAGRSGDTLFYYRALVFPYAVFMMLFWLYSVKWLDFLHGYRTITARFTFWLGLTGSIGLLIYIDYLGTTGDMNELLRRTGAALYFVLIPLAQCLLHYQHYQILRNKPENTLDSGVLRYQLIIVLLMLIVAVASIILVATGKDSYEIQNIVEWNFSLLINLYSAGMIVLWKDFRLVFTGGRH